jgi:hypothetical protein
MFVKFQPLLPQLFRPGDVARLRGLVPATQQDDKLSALFAAINPQPRSHINSQLENPSANALVISEVSGTHSGQAGVHCGLHSQVAQGLKPVIERHPAVLQFQLPDFAFGHWTNVNYGLQVSTHGFARFFGLASLFGGS